MLRSGSAAPTAKELAIKAANQGERDLIVAINVNRIARYSDRDRSSGEWLPSSSRWFVAGGLTPVQIIPFLALPHILPINRAEWFLRSNPH